MCYIENSKRYITVLKNISNGTPVQTEAEELIFMFEQNIKKQGENTLEYWHCKAQNDFHGLLNQKIKYLQELQEKAINGMLNVVQSLN